MNRLLGKTRSYSKRLSYIPRNLKKLSIQDKLELIDNLEQQKIDENDYKKHEIKELFTKNRQYCKTSNN
jgi:hypothetical protein